MVPLGPINRMALRNSLANWRYSLATVLTFGTGLLCLWVFRGYMLSAQEMYRDHFTARSMFGHVLIESRKAGTMDDDLKAVLTSTDQQAVAEFIRQQGDHLRADARFLELEGQVSLASQQAIFTALAYDVKGGQELRGGKWQWNAVAGRPLQEAGEVILGRELASLLGCSYSRADYLERLGDGPAYAPVERPFHCPGSQALVSVTTVRGQANARYLNIVGFMDAGFRDVDRSWLMLSLADGQALLNTTAISWWALALREPGEAAAVAHGFNTYAQAHGLALIAQTWEELRYTDLYRRTMSLLGLFETLVLGILLSIIGLAVFNLMVKVVQERRREIGLLRSLGFRRLTLYRLFLTEALLTTLVGLALGTGAAGLVTFAANHAGILYQAGIFSEPVPFAISLAPHLWVVSAAPLATIGLVASGLAVARTLRRSITECLA